MPAFVGDLVTDLGEPFCFACRNRYLKWEFVETKATAKHSGVQPLYKHWNTLPLERAHIIPLSRGGSNRLKNLLLLCKTCHSESPDVIESSFLLRWLQNRRTNLMNRQIRDWFEACIQLDVDPKKVMNQKTKIMQEWRIEFSEFSANFSTHHFNEYPTSTEVACLVAFAEQKGIDGELSYVEENFFNR